MTKLTEELIQPYESSFIKDKSLLKKSMIVLLAVIVLFSLQNFHHIEVSVIALGGAAVLLVKQELILKKYYMRWTGQH